jgi:predicted esterase
VVEGWTPQFADRTALGVLLRHGVEDPVIEIGFARTARRQIARAGLELDYAEFLGGHTIPPSVIPAAQTWLGAVIP